MKLRLETLKETYFWASIFYIIPAAGYVIMDGIVGFYPGTLLKTSSELMFLILAVLYLIDSVLYYICWNKWRSHYRWNVAMWGEILNVAGSVGFVVAATFSFVLIDEVRILEQFGIILISFWLNELGVLLFLIDSLMYYSAFHNVLLQTKKLRTNPDADSNYALLQSLNNDVNINISVGLNGEKEIESNEDGKDDMIKENRKKCCRMIPKDSKWRDFGYLGEFLNVIPSGIYVLGGIYFIVNTTAILSTVDKDKQNINQVIEVIMTLLAQTHFFYFVADIIFLFDSFFYFFAYLVTIE